ncbi:MAG: type II secretion system major pseudopilin GspG [Rhodobacteraceae bacterium]|jgi:general secretion pathway protein G|nr:type II secretion system major pseudopilin GspG [Paracoccaceae bacterium]
MQVNRKNVTRRNPRRGISLLEIMVVLAIIALVAGLAAPRIMETFGRAKSQAASIQLQSIKGALQLFYIDVGRYPSEIEGLEALLVEPDGVSGWRGPYLDDPDGLSDPWGRPFVYTHPGSNSAFDLLTYGRDGRPGGSAEDSDIEL